MVVPRNLSLRSVLTVYTRTDPQWVTVTVSEPGLLGKDPEMPASAASC